ncbi:hypothetical protein CHS0354_017470 [Potamilus streckersoni]|uniref:Sialate O-acetylesterase domain-containing protein n=1 Tax=Potamilus streckersoni TaxID=2493646 RepID=A0AAE0TJC8_9BIVA|nr:hypothetical protein CHS0354_017470 [Potamilus streckersoni]
MVLQKAPKRNIIWGYASTVSSMVTVTLSGHPPVTTQVVDFPMAGKATWKVQLSPVSDPGPYEIYVESVDGNIQIVDILFGDVWLCSGQSNMEFTLPQALNASQDMVDSYNYHNIRVFTVDLKTSDNEEYDLLGVMEHWSVPSNATVGYAPWQYFSAVCWLYGKYLYQHLKYPIGLISSTWGGTPIEACSSKDAIAQCGGDNEREEVSRFPDPDLSKLAAKVGTNQLWNAMIHPLLNLTIYGVVWYQGKSNAGNPEKYKCQFPAMINDWRAKFYVGTLGEVDSKYPFGFVQLAPNRNDPTITTGFPDLRWAQTADYGYVPNPIMPKVFMAVAMDLPDFDSPYGGFVHLRLVMHASIRTIRENAC